MHNSLVVKVVQAEGNLCDQELYALLWEVTHPVEVESEITAEHEIEDHEEVLVILEGISEVAHEWTLNLLEQSPFLNDVLDGVLLDAAL